MRALSFFIAFVSVFYSLHVWAAPAVAPAVAPVEVVFFELYDKGKRVELEAGGQYYHVAIKTEAGWLHSHPGAEGVTFLKDLSQISKKFVILENPNAKAVSLMDVHRYLGLPFDFFYRWNDERTSYCSKLVAQILGIPPKPMSFSSEHWGQAFGIERGEVGLSPDDLFDALLERGYRFKIDSNADGGSMCSRHLLGL